MLGIFACHTHAILLCSGQSLNTKQVERPDWLNKVVVGTSVNLIIEIDLAVIVKSLQFVQLLLKRTMRLLLTVE